MRALVYKARSHQLFCGTAHGGRYRHLRDQAPFAIQDGYVALTGGAGSILRYLSGDELRFCDCIVIARAIQSGRINQPVTVFDIEKIACQRSPNCSYCRS